MPFPENHIIAAIEALVYRAMPSAADRAFFRVQILKREISLQFPPNLPPECFPASLENPEASLPAPFIKAQFQIVFRFKSDKRVSIEPLLTELLRNVILKSGSKTVALILLPIETEIEDGVNAVFEIISFSVFYSYPGAFAAGINPDLLDFLSGKEDFL